MVLRRKRLSIAINEGRGRVYFCAVTAGFRREIHDRMVKLGQHGQGGIQRFLRPLPEAIEGVNQRSSRNPRKNGWRTFPSEDFARY